MTAGPLRLSIALLVILTLAGPAAAYTGWSGKGSHEPDTSYDVNDGWMFLSPDISPCGTTFTPCNVEKVYFNGFLGQCEPLCYSWYSTINPNVGAAGSGFLPAPFYTSDALFGVWKDCNKDGYVGLGDQGVLEYRTSLLLDTSVCPIQPVAKGGAGGNPPLGWFPSHNDGNWVHEYIPITLPQGVDGIGRDPNPWNIEAPDAAVWADAGTPGQPRTTDGAGCGLYFQPVGTYRSTGGLLRFPDCYLGWRVTDNFDKVADNVSVLAPFSFSDASRDQGSSNSILNQQNPWGSENDAGYVQAWDCSQAQVYEKPTSGPIAGSGTPPTGYDTPFLNVHNLNVSRPAVPPQAHAVAPTVKGLHGDAVSTNGYSVAGTVNDFGSGFDHCTRDAAAPRQWLGGYGTGMFFALAFDEWQHYGNLLATFPYQTEGGAISFAKTGADGVMGPGGTIVCAVYFDCNRPDGALAVVLGPGTPPFLSLDSAFSSSNGIWVVPSGQMPPYVDSNQGKPMPPAIESYYAYVGASTIQKYNLCMPHEGSCGTLGSTGTYGQEACQGETTGVVNGWDCDPTHWGVPCGSGECVVGSAYDLRDVDCYDTSVAAARAHDVSWGTLSATNCPTP